MALAPMIEFEGRQIVMVPQETNRLVQPGLAQMISRREVEGTIRKLENYERTNHPQFEAKGYAAKLAAYRELLAAGDPPAKKKG